MSSTLARPISVPLYLLLGSLAAIAPLSTDMYLPAGDVELSFSSCFIGMLAQVAGHNI